MPEGCGMIKSQLSQNFFEFMVRCLVIVVLVVAVVLAENAKADVVGVDDDLAQAIQLAVETHPSIAAAKASAQAAGSDVRSAKWLRFPSVSVEGTLLDTSTIAPKAQLVVDQPLWTGGRVSGTIQRATAQKGAAAAVYDEAVLSIASGTAQAFYEVHRWRGRADILDKSLVEHNRLVDTMQRRYAQEISPLSDLELARSRALQVQMQIFVARAQEASALSRLREFVSDPLFATGNLAAPSPETSWPAFADAAMISQAISFSPLLKKLDFERQASSAQVRVARASILPQLSSQYSYSENFGHRVGLVLKAQTDGGLSRFASADAAKQRAQASELQSAAGERQVRDQVFALLREYESATSRLGGSKAASLASERVMESYMRQFTSGRRTWIDVMNAVRETSSAEIDALEAQIASQSGLVRLMLLTGLWAPVAAEGSE
jgi:adhesin transport system outer membrane protein